MVPNIHEYRPVIQISLAYIDPESGSLLIQLLSAAVIGFLAHFRRTVSAVLSKLVAARKPTATRLD